MRLSILGFVLGVWFLQRQAALPDWRVLAALFAVSGAISPSIAPSPNLRSGFLVMRLAWLKNSN